jgi:hypothetical protein
VKWRQHEEKYDSTDIERGSLNGRVHGGLQTLRSSHERQERSISLGNFNRMHVSDRALIAQKLEAIFAAHVDGARQCL